jgi:CRP-like cAMP-binding protein
MNIQHLEMTAFLDRMADYAAQNLTIAKLLSRLNLDPTNITFDVIFQRLTDLVIANITAANICALVGAGFYAASFLMRTMVPLRVLSIVSAFFFMAYGALGGALATFLLYLMLLPVQSLRLFQIIKLVKKAKVALNEDLSVDWLKPFMDRRIYRAGDVLFRKGDRANEMFLIITGKFQVAEIGVEMLPGSLVGEIGFLTPNNKRTQSVRCVEDGAVLTISYDRLLEVYFDNPNFAIYLLRLSSNRLLHNNARLEKLVEQYKGKPHAAAPTV